MLDDDDGQDRLSLTVTVEHDDDRGMALVSIDAATDLDGVVVKVPTLTDGEEQSIDDRAIAAAWRLFDQEEESRERDMAEASDAYDACPWMYYDESKDYV